MNLFKLAEYKVQIQDKVSPESSDYLLKVIDCAVAIRKRLDVADRNKKNAIARYKKWKRQRRIKN